MLQAYADQPDAFTATVAERTPLPLSWWAERTSDAPGSPELVYGAFVDAQLIGVAGLEFGRQRRTAHKATLFGMFVQPPFRGEGTARALVGAVVKHAESAPGTRILRLSVTESNTPALRLYASCGFRAFGTEPYALRVGDRFLSKVHMWRSVGPVEEPPG